MKRTENDAPAHRTRPTTVGRLAALIGINLRSSDRDDDDDDDLPRPNATVPMRWRFFGPLAAAL